MTALRQRVFTIHIGVPHSAISLQCSIVSLIVEILHLYPFLPTHIYQTSAMVREQQKKTSVTQLVHSTIGLSLEDEVSLAEATSLEEKMAGRLQFTSKSGTGSVSSDKVALKKYDDALSLDQGRRQSPKKMLINQASQDR